MSNNQKPLRRAMPTVAAWIDELREAFGVEMINEAIRNGVDGGTDFHARENGHEIGTEFPADRNRAVNLADCQIGPMNKPRKEDHGRR